LKKGAMKDWMTILQAAGVYDKEKHNKTDHTFRLEQSTVEFFSVDEPGKARGLRRDILYINEANLIPLETYRQLELRTRKTIYLDYNPADEYHWIYDQLLDAKRSDVTFIKSNYQDNPFLTDQEIAHIERYRSVDENYWRVYGLGERGSSRSTIYTHWQQCDTLPESGEEIWGLDFGYNNPTAIVQVKIYDDDIYVRERLYRSHITNPERIAWLKTTEVPPVIYADADSAEPEFIDEIYSAGFNVHKANKDVIKGIDTVRARNLYITRDSVNLIKEIKSYKYKEDMEGRTLEEPVKLNDHLCDAMRYAVHTYFSNPDHGKYAVL
jgi:phage terminase large subunit